MIYRAKSKKQFYTNNATKTIHFFKQTIFKNYCKEDNHSLHLQTLNGLNRMFNSHQHKTITK